MTEREINTWAAAAVRALLHKLLSRLAADHDKAAAELRAAAK